MQYRVNDGTMTVKAHEVEFVETAARRIMAHYNAADEGVRASGIDWYVGEGRGLAERVAQETGITFEEAAAVVASNSQRTNWAVQKRHTSAFVRHILEGGAVKTAPRASTFDTVLARSARLLLTGDFSEVLAGIKIGAFYRNICGDYSVVTIDVWAIRVVLGRDADEEIAKGWTKGRKHQLLQAAYHRAAELLGENVAAVQAVAWVVIRDSKLDLAA